MVHHIETLMTKNALKCKYIPTIPKILNGHGVSEAMRVDLKNAYRLPLLG
jgi:hypothetical protein